MLVSPPDHPRLFVVQPPEQQWRNLASKLDRCLVLASRPMGEIFVEWYAHTTTGREAGIQSLGGTSWPSLAQETQPREGVGYDWFCKTKTRRLSYGQPRLSNKSWKYTRRASNAAIARIGSAAKSFPSTCYRRTRSTKTPKRSRGIPSSWCRLPTPHGSKCREWSTSYSTQPLHKVTTHPMERLFPPKRYRKTLDL